MPLTTTTAIFLYIFISALIWRHATAAPAKITNATTIRLLVSVVIFLHGLQLYGAIYISDGVTNLALGNVVSLVAWMTVALFLIASLAKQTLNIGLIVMPSGLVGLIIGATLPGEPFLLEDLPRGIGRHIAIAIPAYGVLSIAFAQALLLWVQERQLRKPEQGRFFPALPALETMESNLVQLTLLGFGILTVNLFTGMFNTWQNYGVVLLFNHHILLALAAWAGFGGLLLGRLFFGWRGRLAAKWTVVAFLVLALAYFGTRFVGGVILG